MSATERLELDDMQGLILRGYGGLPHACFLLLQVDRAAAACRWLGQICSRLTVADARPDEVAVNLALTVPGMVTLGLPVDAAQSFPLEMREGMVTEHRSRVLGDLDESAPQHWSFGGPATPAVHVLLLAYARDAARLARLVDELERGAQAGGLELLRRLETSAIGRAEHFGFRDGISQPRLAGVGSVSPDQDQTVRAGEFVLGYQDEYGQYAVRPRVAANDDPQAVLANDVEGGGAHDFGRNGSYLVLRQLEQDVPGFWRFAEAAAGAGGEADGEAARIAIAAKMVGRWPSGAPLVLAPDADPPSIAGLALNAFRYHREDAAGLRCPVGAHVRRTNPRDTLDPDPGSDASVGLVKHHRLLRRGRSYGPRLPIERALDSGAAGGEPRGLYFMCLNTNLPRQFEFVQQTWVTSPKFGGLYDEPDPVVAPGGDFSIPDVPVRRRLTGVPRFVTVRGGAYLLLPGLRAIRYLSGLSGGEPGNSS